MKVKIKLCKLSLRLVKDGKLSVMVGDHKLH